LVVGQNDLSAFILFLCSCGEFVLIDHTSDAIFLLALAGIHLAVISVFSYYPAAAMDLHITWGPQDLGGKVMSNSMLTQ